MSLLDENLVDKVDEIINWHNNWDFLVVKILVPAINKLQNMQKNYWWADGIVVPENFPWDVGLSIKSMCDSHGVNYIYLNCNSLSSRTDLSNYYDTLLNKDGSVIIIDNFDQLPDSDDKKYIENLIVLPWAVSKLIPREHYLIVFVIRNSQLQHKSLLNKIKRLHWYNLGENLTQTIK